MVGHVVVQRGNGNVAPSEFCDIGSRFEGVISEWIKTAPIIRPTSWIDAFLDGVVVPLDPHRGELYSNRGLISCGRKIDVPQVTGLWVVVEQPSNQRQYRPGGVWVVGRNLRVLLDRDRDRGDSEERPFDGSSDSAGVEHIDADVRAGIDATDDQVGAASTEFKYAEFDAVGGAAVHGPAVVLAVFKDLFDHNRMQVGDSMADAALFCERSHSRHMPQFAQHIA